MIKFCKNKKWYFSISLAIMLIGIVFIFINGVKLDIQFTGGTKVTYSYQGTIDETAVKKEIESATKLIVTTQQSTSSIDGVNSLIVSFASKDGLSAEQLDQIDQIILTKFTDNAIERQSTVNVEPYIGHRFLKRGILAVVLALILIIGIVTIRFKIISGFSAALCALTALFHDVIIVFFVFVIMGIPLNDGFIAVVLTILGYSINDTLVIYDRIRENKKLHGDKKPLEEIVDMSINQCFRRCIFTSVLTFTAMLLVFIFAAINNISSVVNFALPLMIGIVSGSYSSMCLASPIWVAWQNKKALKRK